MLHKKRKKGRIGLGNQGEARGARTDQGGKKLELAAWKAESERQRVAHACRKIPWKSSLFHIFVHIATPTYVWRSCFLQRWRLCPRSCAWSPVPDLNSKELNRVSGMKDGRPRNSPVGRLAPRTFYGTEPFVSGLVAVCASLVILFG